MIMLEKFGIITANLQDQRKTINVPPTVKGRVAHIDGDILAYMVATGSDNVHTMKHNLDVAVETFRLLSGAERTVLHTTASYGTKGDRYNQAIQKEYQANRKNKPKPEHLLYIKSWIKTNLHGIEHADQEADDGMCQAAFHAPLGEVVIVSSDKDLGMCRGLHLDWNGVDLETVDGFGYITITETDAGTKKLVGKGTKFFWAQMLMGDAADNIQGLPCLLGQHLNKYKPTKATLKAIETIKDDQANPKFKEKAYATLEERKPSTVGAVIAYEILKDTANDLEAYNIVRSLYEDIGETLGFLHWYTAEPATAEEVFLSEGRLLWLRRNKNNNDFDTFINEVLNG